MENQDSTEAGSQVDRDFLKTVEAEIGLALSHALALEAGLEEFTFDPGSAWEDAFDRMSANLTGWERRLGDLSDKTAEAESQLSGLETNLRGWFQSLGMTKSRLVETSTREIVA